MGIRETMNEKKGLAVGITIGLIAVAIGFGLWYTMWSEKTAPIGDPNKAFYTDDFGKSFFVDSSEKIPPFDHNGKQAYGCQVFTNDGGKTKFVAWLFRYTDEGKRRFEAMKTKDAALTGGIGASPYECMELKKPGAGDDVWTKVSDPKSIEIQQPPSPTATMVRAE